MFLWKQNERQERKRREKKKRNIILFWVASFYIIVITFNKCKQSKEESKGERIFLYPHIRKSTIHLFTFCRALTTWTENWSWIFSIFLFCFSIRLLVSMHFNISCCKLYLCLFSLSISMYQIQSRLNVTHA